MRTLILNRRVAGKEVELEPLIPFRPIVGTHKMQLVPQNEPYLELGTEF